MLFIGLKLELVNLSVLFIELLVIFIHDISKCDVAGVENVDLNTVFLG